VQDLSGKLSVSLDLEVDGGLSLGEAHTIASQLETAIREELGSETEVETHIEPLVVSSLVGRDVSDEKMARVTDSLTRNAGMSDTISDVHNVRARETEYGLIVNYHCRVDPALDVTSVHESVDRLEHLVRKDFPEIVRIVSHTEPTRDGKL
jgi:divalent metal cation (Fe/Co/Zn/Cd) transporter